MGEGVEREVGGVVVVLPVPVLGAAGGRRVGVGLRGEADGLRQVMPRLRSSLVDFEDGDIDDDLGTGAVEIVQELLREEQLVRGGAHDDGVLAGDEVDLDAGVEQVADGDDDFVGVVLLGWRW